MSSENGDGRPLDTASINSDLSKKKELSYSREFLLSLSNLDSCKKLPSGFDESLISELEDFLVRVTDRPRIPGTFHGFRRNEHGMSPPTQGDGGNYSKGIHGKWDSRSSLRSDRDSDSQSDRDSDSGRRFGYQNRRSWQSPEHDGLLGSGSFPRPSGYASGVPGPKLRVNELNKLNRSNEPYHPPRPYKALPHSRRDTDSLNDETFGSMECTSEDRAEAEKRRRASFEMMRKEQQKALQEKQKLNLEKQKGGVISDLCEALADSKEEKRRLDKNNDSEFSGGIPILSNDLEKSSFSSHSPASRPLVPPGFKSNTIEKGSGLKPLVHPPLSQVGKSVTVKSVEASDAYLIASTNSGLEKHPSQELRINDGQPAEKMHPAPFLNERENVNQVVSIDLPAKKSGKEDQTFYKDFQANLVDPVVAELNSGVLEEKNASGSNKNSSSILGNILASTLFVDDRQSKHYNGKPGDTSGIWSPNSVKSSKFAQWFLEEETSAAADVSSSTPHSLPSFIVSGDRANGISDQVPIKLKEEAVPAILTCEDLEQSILSEYSAKATDVLPSIEEVSNLSDSTGEKTDTHVDNHASLHLLSMLKKTTDRSDTTTNTIADINAADNPMDSQEKDIAKMFKHKVEENIDYAPNSGKTLTLESLFGTAFMKELQSVKEPVSVQRGSVGTTQVDHPSEDRGLRFPIMDSVQGPNHELSSSMNHAQCTKVNETDNWLGFSNLPTGEIQSKVVDFQLPEENNLFSIGDTCDPRVSKFMPIDNSISSSSLSSKATGNLNEKLGMEGSGRMHFPFNSYGKMETTIHRNMQMPQSSAHFQPTPQMPNSRTLPYNHLDSHLARMGSQSKFLGLDLTFNLDPHANSQISPNIVRPFPHPNVRVAGFDIRSQHPLMHQMQMPGNHPLHFPRGFLAPQSGNQGSRLVPEMNQVQGFPFGPHQPSTGGRGMLIPGNPPEALQGLIEMELRANSKQIHPLASIHNPDVMLG